jgi:hypothetical protein
MIDEHKRRKILRDLGIDTNLVKSVEEDKV